MNYKKPSIPILFSFTFLATKHNTNFPYCVVVWVMACTQKHHLESLSQKPPPQNSPQSKPYPTLAQTLYFNTLYTSPIIQLRTKVEFNLVWSVWRGIFTVYRGSQFCYFRNQSQRWNPQLHCTNREIHDSIQSIFL